MKSTDVLFELEIHYKNTIIQLYKYIDIQVYRYIKIQLFNYTDI